MTRVNQAVFDAWLAEQIAPVSRKIVA